MVQNSKISILNKIAYKEILLQKRRNIMVIIAIILATFILALCSSMASAFYYSQKKLSNDTFEVLFYNLSSQKIKQLESYDDIDRVALINNLIEEVNENGETISLSYYDNNAYYIGRNQFKLLEGNLPQKGNEIVASKEYLERYAPDCRIGDDLILQVANEKVGFNLVGIVSFPTATEKNHSFFITKDFLESSAYYDSSSYTAYVHFKNASKISNEKLKERGVEIAHDLDATYDYSALFFNNSKELSIGNMILFLCLSIIVLFAGIIVIQSVFYISINENIRNYGQLCVLGMTKKQLKKIIKKESRILVIIGAPLGILLGDIVGTILGSNQLTCGFNFRSVLVLSVAIFLICTIMVTISVYKPIKLIMDLSLIEAEKYIGDQSSQSNKRKNHKRISPFSLALLNIYCDKKKVFRTMLSLVFGGILMLVSASMVVSFSAEQEVQTKIFKNKGDYRIFITETDKVLNNNPLDYKLQQNIISLNKENKIVPLRKSVGECDLRTGEVYVGGLCDIISNNGAFESNPSFVKKYLTQGEMPSTRNEILLADVVQEVRPVSIGDQATLKIGESKVEVSISGFYDATYVGTSNGAEADDGANVMITEELAQNLFPNVTNFTYSWEIVSGRKDNITMENKLFDLASGKNISICSFEDEVSSLQSQMNIIWGGVQVISLFILLFAIVNLINMLLSNFNSRRYELSIMRSVGLTQKQLNQMFIVEGCIYSAISMGITIIVGTPISVLICKYFGKFIGQEEMVYKFPGLYIVLYGVVILLLQSAFSKWFVKSLNKHTIREQLHSIE